jgi:hypothetical protein
MIVSPSTPETGWVVIAPRSLHLLQLWADAGRFTLKPDNIHVPHKRYVEKSWQVVMIAFDLGSVRAVPNPYRK